MTRFLKNIWNEAQWVVLLAIVTLVLAGILWFVAHGFRLFIGL